MAILRTTGVTGSLSISSSNLSSGSVLFSIDGYNGRVFSVDDNLSGSLFNVNTIAGLPVIEAFSDNSVNIGRFNAEAIKVPAGGRDVSLGSGSVMFITSSGRVGIGLTTPAYSLHVRDSANVGTIAIGHALYPGLILTNAGSGEFRLDNRTSAGAGFITFYPNGEAGTVGNEAMRITTNRKVGIGTTLPTASLHIKPTTLGADLLILERYASNAKLVYAYEYAADGYLEVRSGADAIVSKLSGYTGTPTYFQSNVGIGTTSPAYKLDVNTSIVSRSNISSPRFSSAGGYVYGVTNSPTWNQSCGTAVNNNATAPDGTTTAGTYTLNSTCASYDMFQSISGLTVGRVYTIGMWVKLGTATNFCLVVNNTAAWNTIGGKAFTSSDGLSTSKWTHISYTFTQPASSTAINLHLGYHAETGVTQQTAGTVFIWNIEMTEFSSTWIGNVEDEIRLPGSSIWTSRGNVGIGTTTPATSLQIGSGTPTSATSGIQFGDDTGTRIYRSSVGTLTFSGSVAGLTLSASTALYGNYGDWSGELNKIQWHSNNLYFVNRGGGSWLFRNSAGSNVFSVDTNGGVLASGYVQAGTYLQTNTNLIYPNTYTSTQRLEVGNTAGNAWIDGLTIAPGGNVVIAGTLNSANSKTTTYSSLTGASGDWFPLFTLTDASDNMVFCSIRTSYHSSLMFTAARGYGPSNTHAITILNAQNNANGGYANITGVRIKQDGGVEIQLSWSAGPTVLIGAQVIGTSNTPSFVASLATTANANTVIDTVTNFTQGMIRATNVLQAGSNVYLNSGGNSYLNGGYLGIGTTSPNYRLDVSGSGIRCFGSGSVEPGFIADYQSSNGYGGFFLHADGTRKWRIGNVGDTSTNPALYIWQEGVGARMYFQNNGQVGIGTTSPASKLDVSGSISLRNTTVLSTGADIFGGLNYDIYGNIRVLRSKSAQADGMYIGYQGDGGPLRFFSNSGTTEFMTIATSGYVGVGTTNPSYKLHVNGGPTEVANQSVASFEKQSSTDGRIANFLNLTGSGYSSHIYIGSNPGRDWKIGKNVLNSGTVGHFQITNDLNQLKMQINASDDSVTFPSSSVSATSFIDSGLQSYGVRQYTVDFTTQSTASFYPIAIDVSPGTDSTWGHSFSIDFVNQSGAAPYNMDSMYGEARGQGWTDQVPFYRIFHNFYDNTERSLLGLWRGTQTFYGVVVYVRGGKNYYVKTTSRSVVGYTSAATIGNAVFAIKNSSGTDVSGTSANIGEMLNLINNPAGFYHSNGGYFDSIGIGTTNAIARLDVRGSHPSGYGIVNVISTDTALLSLDSTGARDQGVRLKYNGVDKWLVGMRDVNESFSFSNTSDTRLVTILQGGNVGLGITTPNNKLHVYNSAGSSTTASNAIAVFEQNSNAGIQVCVPDASEGGLFFSRNGAAYYSAIARNGTDLTLKNASATAVTINSSRYVGIGTTNPIHILDVAGNIRCVPTSYSWAEGVSFSMPTTSSWGGLRWRRERFNNDGNHYVGYTGLDTTDDLVFGSNNAGTQIDNNIRITKAGLVGIGTSSPSAKLHVQGRGLVIQNITGTPRWDNNSFEIRSTGGNGVALEFHREGNTSATIASMAGEISFYTDSGTERMRISPTSGNVGIGTTSPSYLLDVRGNTSTEPYSVGFFRNNNTSSAFGGIIVNGDNQAHIRFLTGTSTWGGAGAKQWQIRTGLAANADALSFYSWTAGSDVFYVNSSGNVGIGTTSPAAKLDVIGTISGSIFSGAGTGLTGTAASLTAGAANSVAWTNVSGRPTAVSAFTNDSLYQYHRTDITSLSSSATNLVQPLGTFDANNATNGPTNAWYNYFSSTHGSYLTSLIANRHRSSEWYVAYKEGPGGTPTNPTWYQLLHSGNYNSFAVALTGDQTVAGNKTFSGITTFSNASDYQISLNGGGTTWAGIQWVDTNGTEYMWYNGQNKTFALGGGGSNVVNKKLHVDGAVTIGADYDATDVIPNSLNLQGPLQVGDYITYVLNNLSANATQARTYEIARLGIDYNDWNAVGTFEVELHEQYYNRGLKKVYNIWYGYVSNSGVRLVEWRGSGTNNFQCRIGTQVQISGDNYYLPVYVDVREYSIVDVVIKTNRRYTSSSSPAIGYTYINLAPSPTNISDFTADSDLELTTLSTAKLGGNTILNSSNYTSYSPTITGSTVNGLTVAGGNATISRDLIVNGGTGNPYGNRIIVQGTATTYTLQDSLLRPTVYLNGDYPVLSLNNTATTNANHGPTLQFAFNGLTTGGSTSRQIVIGANGVGTWLDFGFSGGASGTNSDYNPHNGISGYSGITIMRLFNNGVLIGNTGAYPNHITSTSYSLDVRGSGYISSSLIVNGNVGIGTTVPTTKLHVIGDISGSGQIRTDTGFYSAGTTYFEVLNIGTRINVEGGANEGIYFGDSNRWIIDTCNADHNDNADGELHFRDYTNSVTRMLIQYSTGNVGIGTTIPYDKLLVHGGTGNTTAYDSTIGLSRISSTGNVLSSKIVLTAPSSNTNYGSLVFRVKTTPSAAESSTYYKDAINIDGQTANVGIGTTSPNSKLNVNSSGSLVSGSVVFRVEGTQGSLFSVDDSLSGSLMSVNDISGLPILEVFSDDRVVMGTFNANTLVVTGSRVGIGTNIPATSLQIGSGTPTAATSGIQFGDDTGARLYRGGANYIQASSGLQTSAWFYAATYIQTGNSQIYPGSYSGILRLGVGNSANNNWIDGLTIAPGGNVAIAGNTGIGGAATRSTSGLTVGFTNNTTFATNSDVGDGVRFLSIVNESTTTNAMTVLGFRVNPNGATTNAMMDIKFVNTGATNGSALHYTFNHSGSFTDRFSILSNGNVGIGTTNPTSLLHVYNNDARYFSYSSGLFTIQRNILSTGGSSPTLTLINTQGHDLTTGRGSSIQFDLGYGGSGTAVGTAARGARIAALGDTLYSSNIDTQNASLALYTSISGSNTEKMRINCTGDVGIGTTSPSYKLDVSGSIRTNSKFVQQSTTQSITGTGQTLTLNVSLGAIHVISMASGATITTISYTNRDNNPSVNTIMLVVKYAGTASITWTNVLWANGVNPTLTATNGYADVFMLTSYQGGAGTPVWIGSVVSYALTSTNL